MAQIVVMPALGNTVESCLISAWSVKVGDTVDTNTVLCEIETDKSVIEVPADVAGTVLALLAAEGDDVPVKSPIAVIGDAGENVEQVLAAAGRVTGEAGEVDESASAPDAQAPAAPAAPAEPSDAAHHPIEGTPSASPRARGLAAREGLPLDAVGAGTGPHGRVIERDVAAALAEGPRPTRGARDADLSGVGQGTGLGGRVSLADLAAVRTQPATPAAPAAPLLPATRGTFPGAYADTPLKGIRKLIAERMRSALAVSAQLTYTSTASATGMLALRKRFKASDPDLGYTGITLGDLVSFATVQVLRRHANLNAHLLDAGVRTFESVHLGVAVDTPRGLLVPTIRNADTLSLRGLSAATKQLAEAARAGNIDPELLAGATFTVSNLGSFGIEHFTPIVNVPQTGILGVNTITPRATVRPDGTFGVEQRIGFSLTADHQVVDGADAGRFLADLVRAIENVDLTVLG